MNNADKVDYLFHINKNNAKIYLYFRLKSQGNFWGNQTNN